MFDTVLPPAPHALQQSDGFARALTAIGTPHLRLSNGTLVVHRRFGPLTAHMITRPAAEDLFAMRRLLAEAGLQGPVILAPDCPTPLGQIGALPLVSPLTHAVLNLTPDASALMSGLQQKWRNRLRHAQSLPLRITRQNMPDDASHWLLVADEIQQGLRKYRSWPRALTLAFARENSGDAKLFTAFWGRDPVAAILVLRHGDTATYHIGHARPSGRIASAHTLLMWSAILWAQSKHLTRFDLGTVQTEDGAGLARFKLGTGAQPRALGGTWIYWPPVTTPFVALARLDRRLMQAGP